MKTSKKRKTTAKAAPVATAAKSKATVSLIKTDHTLNLRCPHEECNYLAKVTEAMLKLGRLRCPIHPRAILKTREERGETRGRQFSKAA